MQGSTIQSFATGIELLHSNATVADVHISNVGRQDSQVEAGTAKQSGMAAALRAVQGRVTVEVQ